MKTHNKWFWILVTGVLVVGISLSSLLALPAGAMAWLSEARSSTPAEAPQPNLVLQGAVDLQYAAPGVYTDAISEPISSTLPDLGTIDLGLKLVRNGNEVDGSVDLDYTLVFTGVVNEDGSVRAPMVSGTFSGDQLTLTSEKLALTWTGMRLQRQFQMTGTVKDGVFTGEYRETVWGYGPQPMTMVGSFAQGVWEGAVQNLQFFPLVRKK